MISPNSELGVATRSMRNALFVCCLLPLILAGCERKIARVQPTNPTPTPAVKFDSKPTNFTEWEQRAKQIPIGMRRTEVERILPAYWGSARDGNDLGRFASGGVGSGNRKTISYHVSDDVIVSFTYDWPQDPSTSVMVAPVEIRHENQNP